eukprot:443879-Rhodomonas_salina.1
MHLRVLRSYGRSTNGGRGTTTTAGYSTTTRAASTDAGSAATRAFPEPAVQLQVPRVCATGASGPTPRVRGSRYELPSTRPPICYGAATDCPVLTSGAAGAEIEYAATRWLRSCPVLRSAMLVLRSAMLLRTQIGYAATEIG